MDHERCCCLFCNWLEPQHCVKRPPKGKKMRQIYSFSLSYKRALVPGLQNLVSDLARKPSPFLRFDKTFISSVPDTERRNYVWELQKEDVWFQDDSCSELEGPVQVRMMAALLGIGNSSDHHESNSGSIRIISCLASGLSVILMDPQYWACCV